MSITFNPGGNASVYSQCDMKSNHKKKNVAEKEMNQQITTSKVGSMDTRSVPLGGYDPWQKDSVFIAGNASYYNTMAKDYLEGALSEESFYSQLEEIYNANSERYGNASFEKKQEIFNAIIHEAYNGILEYYLAKNAEEWRAQASDTGQRVDFYYNTDYHYQHLNQREAFIDRTDALAESLGFDGLGERLNRNVLTVNGRMSIMANGSAGQFLSQDVPPPEGMKIMLSVSYEPYEATVIADGKEYKTGIPFDYDTLTYEFSLEELFSKFEIPDRYMAFIRNITVLNRAIMRFDPNAKERNIDPLVMGKISAYENSMDMASKF